VNPVRWSLFALVLSVLPAFPQELCEVRGSVVDARGGEALSNVAVQLGRRSLSRHFRRRCRFVLASVEAGDYVLSVSTVGYRMIKKPFHLGAGESLEFEIVLSPDAFRQTDAVEVTAGPSRPRARIASTPEPLSGNDARTWLASWPTTRCAPCKASRASPRITITTPASRCAAPTTAASACTSTAFLLQLPPFTPSRARGHRFRRRLQRRHGGRNGTA